LLHGAKIMFLHDYSKDCNRLFGLTRISDSKKIADSIK
jgi:hypothetical protein